LLSTPFFFYLMRLEKKRLLLACLVLFSIFRTPALVCLIFLPDICCLYTLRAIFFGVYMEEYSSLQLRSRLFDHTLQHTPMKTLNECSSSSLRLIIPLTSRPSLTNYFGVTTTVQHTCCNVKPYFLQPSAKDTYPLCVGPFLPFSLLVPATNAPLLLVGSIPPSDQALRGSPSAVLLRGEAAARVGACDEAGRLSQAKACDDSGGRAVVRGFRCRSRGEGYRRCGGRSVAQRSP